MWLISQLGGFKYQFWTNAKLELVNRDKINPVQSEPCTIMRVMNLASPEWISISCHQRFLRHAVCFKSMGNFSLVQVKEPNFNFSHNCPRRSFLKNKTCFLPTWFEGKQSDCHKIRLTCALHQMTLHTIKKIQNFAFVFHAVKKATFSILSLSHKTAQSFQYERTWFSDQYLVANFSFPGEIQGFMVCEKKSQGLHLHSGNVFHCLSGMVISALYLCDGSADCSDSSDEATHMCSHLKNDFTTVQSGSIFSHLVVFNNSTTASYTCSDNTTIGASLLNDLVTDCHESLDDETDLLHLLKFDKYQTCKIAGTIPCREGHTKCFNISHLCVYSINQHHVLGPCRTGEHLEDCTEFECHQHFKCSGYYCVPYAYSCDGKWDCPRGDDESVSLNCEQRLCENMFKCKNAIACIHGGDICDNNGDCPSKDDEMMCDLEDTCLEGCSCFQYSIRCCNVSFGTPLPSDLPYVSFHFTFTDLLDIKFSETSQKLKFLFASNNRISDICSSVGHLTFISIIDASINNLKVINSGCFDGLRNRLLSVVNLGRNTISHIEMKAFVSLTSLSLVDVSRNCIEHLPEGTFYNISNLQRLILTDNPLTELDTEMFHHFEVKSIETKKYKICCLAPAKTSCPVLPPWYTSCFRLFSDMKMRLLFVIISVLILTANVLSFVGHLHKCLQSNLGTAYHVIVSFVNIGDTLCGQYLTVIWIADAQYIDTFIVNETKWRRSYNCLISFYLLFLFSVLVPYFLVVLSTARFMVILYPFNRTFKSKSFVGTVLFFGTLVSVVVSTAFTISIVQQNIIPSNLCSPFLDPTR